MINSSHEIWRGSASVFSVPTARISHSSDAPEEMGTPVKRRGRPPGSENKKTLAKEATDKAATEKAATEKAAAEKAAAEEAERAESERLAATEAAAAAAAKTFNSASPLL